MGSILEDAVAGIPLEKTVPSNNNN
jgi:hypothetical protein